MKTKRRRYGCYGAAPTLPCGCRIKNRQGAMVYSQFLKLKDGRYVCKCGVLYRFDRERRDFVSLPGGIPA